MSDATIAKMFLLRDKDTLFITPLSILRPDAMRSESARGLAQSKTLTRGSDAAGRTRSVLECGGPPPLFTATPAAL